QAIAARSPAGPPTATSGESGRAPLWQALAGQEFPAGSGAASAPGSACVARQSPCGAGQTPTPLASRTRAATATPTGVDRLDGAVGERLSAYRWPPDAVVRG